ncbi:MAG TPA: hypothetical protein DHU75_01830 [Rikenellaceae bacterium]|nr:hypothetical protein [Rikenellaceae bacterium]
MLVLIFPVFSKNFLCFVTAFSKRVAKVEIIFELPKFISIFFTFFRFPNRKECKKTRSSQTGLQR